MSVVAELQAPVEYLAIYERAHRAVLSWEPSPAPVSAAPVDAVEWRGVRLVPHRGGRLHSLMPCVLAVLGPLAAGIYAGGGFR